MSIKKLTRTTAADVADLVEYAINETEPTVRTRRGVGSMIEIKVGRRKFVVSVCRPYRRKKPETDVRTTDGKAAPEMRREDEIG